jgi:hypothetical protein
MVEPITVRRRRANGLRTSEWTADRAMTAALGIVPPGKDRSFESSTRGFFPFRLRREPDPEPRFPSEPFAIDCGLVERHSYDGLIGLAESRVVEKRRRLLAGREEKRSILGIGHGRHGHPELGHPDTMDGLLVLPDAGPSHEELPGGDGHPLRF